MDEYAVAFLPTRHEEINMLKRRLARLRVPMAKLQRQGKGHLYDDTAYFLFTDFDPKTGDCLLDVGEEKSSVLGEVEIIEGFFRSFSPEDIVCKAKDVPTSALKIGRQSVSLL